jgi:hypothetical protein
VTRVHANRTDFIRTAIRRQLARSSIRRPAGAHRRADTPTKACASSASGTAVRAGTTTVSLLTEK